MTKKCTVPTDLALNANGVPYYIKCKKKAAYKVGGWLVCENHKKYYTDPNDWPAERLKENE